MEEKNEELNEKDVKKEETKTEQLKSEAANTVNQVKDTIKNVDIKQDSIETKGFVIDIFKDPVKKIKEIVRKENVKYLTYALIILAIWVIAVVVGKCFAYSHVFKYTKIGSAIKEIILTGIAPIVSVLVMSIIAFVMNRKNKKQLTTVMTVVMVACLPLAIAAVVSLLTVISSKISLVTTPFARLCNITSAVLMYFSLKTLFGEEKDTEFIKKFVLIEAIYYACYIVLSLINVYI